MNHILKYGKFLSESLSYPNVKYKEISNEDLDTLPDEEINRILVCSNDGQGDTNCYTFDDIKNILSESDIKYNNVWVKGEEIVPKMKKSEIMDEFCKDLSGNMTEYIYFDVNENKYKKIKWK